MSISAVGVGNVNAVNTVNNRREQLKQKRNLSMLLGTSGLVILGSSLPVKNNITGLVLTTSAALTSLFGSFNFWKANKELNELNKQQNLSIEI
mgnify:CR=1 FL=1